MGREAPILLFDGVCGVCSTTVAFVIRHDRLRGTLRFATLQGAFASELRALHPELGLVDSIVWYQPAHGAADADVKVRSEATIAAGIYLGGIWGALAWMMSLLPRAFRDWAYDAFAARRHKLTRLRAACLLPSPEDRWRFLDLDRGDSGER